MKIWTCGSSPQSGYRNAWTRNKNVKGANRLRNFGFFTCVQYDFLLRLVTMDKTWLYHYDPETKQQSMEWRHSGWPRPKNSKCKNSRSRLDFLGSRRHPSHWLSSKGPNYQRRALFISAGAIERYFLRKNAAGMSPSGSCSCTTLPRLTGHLHSRWNWPTWTSNVFDHPPYSPYLAPPDYHLFPGLKKNWKFAIFVRRGAYCCRGCLVERTFFWFLFEWLAKVRAMG